MSDTPRTDEEEWSAENYRHSSHNPNADKVVDADFARQLEREVLELRKDKARLDWLADVNNNIGQVLLPNKCVINNLASMREAIDEAMEDDQ